MENQYPKPMSAIYFQCTLCKKHLFEDEIHEHVEEHLDEYFLQTMITDKSMKYGKARAEE